MMAAVLSVFPSFGSLVWLVGYRRLQVCDDGVPRPIRVRVLGLCTDRPQVAARAEGLRHDLSRTGWLPTRARLLLPSCPVSFMPFRPAIVRTYTLG